VRKNGWLDKVDMTITMHDELVFDVHPSVLGAFLVEVPEIMAANPVIMSRKWPIPLTVDVELGADWTAPWNLAEIQRDGEMPEVLSEMLGEFAGDILMVDPPIRGEGVADPEDVEASCTYELGELNVDLAFRLAEAIHAASSENGAPLELRGRGAKAVEAALLKAGGRPKVDPDQFMARISKEVSHGNE
jgi:hypothetical protein